MSDDPVRFDRDALRRLVADVQRLGLVTASTVADRFAGMVRGMGTASEAGGGADDLPGVTRMIDGWRAVVEGMVDLTQGIVGGATSPADHVDRIDLVMAPGGEIAEGRAFVHNTTGAAADTVELRCGDLIGPGGAVIPASAVSVAPSAVTGLAAGTSRGVEVTVAVPSGAADGDYHGLLVMSDPPGGALALRLRVERGARSA